MEVMLRVSAEAALRRGEVVGLRWSDFDLQGHTITVARSVWQESGRDGAAPTRYVKSPKAGKAETVAIGAALAARLADWYAESVVENGAPADGYVFPGRDGGPMSVYTPRQALGRICVAAGLVDTAGRPLVTWHGLRHTAASVMFVQGIPLPDVSAHLRHADPHITAQVYAHSLGEDRKRAAAAAFDFLATDTLRETLRDAKR